MHSSSRFILNLLLVVSERYQRVLPIQILKKIATRLFPYSNNQWSLFRKSSRIWRRFSVFLRLTHSSVPDCCLQGCKRLLFHISSGLLVLLRRSDSILLLSLPHILHIRTDLQLIRRSLFCNSLFRLTRLSCRN